jgi:hypothetical protein
LNAVAEEKHKTKLSLLLPFRDFVTATLHPNWMHFWVYLLCGSLKVSKFFSHHQKIVVFKLQVKNLYVEYVKNSYKLTLEPSI